MKNKKARAVIKRLQKANETFTVKLLGDEENKVSGFTIIMLVGKQFISLAEDVYCNVKQTTLNLFDEAEIKYKVI